MNVVFVSQCQKRAINETRRILDQFGERTGVRTWTTPITKAGLDTVRKLLKRTARKNTAVACHWVHPGGDFELMWIVGDARQFDARGRVPTNLTERDVLRSNTEGTWHSARIMALIARLAALFHDFGKANAQFARKLEKPVIDAYRHEWVSLRLFEAFVGGEEDRLWLARLVKMDTTPNHQWLDRLVRDRPDVPAQRPFASMGPIARAVGWLVVSHHALPRIEKANFEDLYAVLGQDWGFHRPDPDHAECWRFPGGTPDQSRTWRAAVARTARAMLELGPLLDERDWSLDPFVMQVARMSLILGDHHYSGQEPHPTSNDPSYKVYANTDRATGSLKQPLDDHLIGVESITRKIQRVLPDLPRQLPRLGRHRAFERPTSDKPFRWQNQAFELAEQCRPLADRHGFFGINLASTGCGKTLANARIMYGLSDPLLGTRFSIALGLRTLTLQTGTALRERMGLDDADMAVMVGGAAVRELYELHQREAAPVKAPGSESSAALLPDDAHVLYEGAISEKSLQSWLDGARGNASKLVQAPILVCTIDHLIQASESTRGGHHIAPMLRLLTSDLVLDEPDDFDLGDLPALTRFVYSAGLLGSRVLLSSATLAPALVEGLFDAYSAGRRAYQQNCGQPGLPLNVCCAWFDEFQSVRSQHATVSTFAEAYAAFVDKRLGRLAQQQVRRRARIEAPSMASGKDVGKGAIVAIANTVLQQAKSLHDAHAIGDEHQRRISVGLVRMANIAPLIEVAQRLLEKASLMRTRGADYRLHICVYHSRFPLLMRSEIEAVLDRVLNRKGDPDPLLAQTEIRRVIEQDPAANHVFLVMASPVAEVGRDHDYDWAIVEPSSMRSMIQLAGRVRRHRDGAVQSHNIVLLDRNYKGLTGQSPAFCRPGFESIDFRLNTHQLSTLIDVDEYESISAQPRIQPRRDLEPARRLVDLEHARLAVQAQDSKRFWTGARWLSGVEQQRNRFRAGGPEMDYFFDPEEPDDVISRLSETGEHQRFPLTVQACAPAEAASLWAVTAYRPALEALAERLGLSLELCARRFGVLSLAVDGDGGHKYAEWTNMGPLGIR
jgi:CRISPR-associated endonuclease/helicase Cas3